MLRNIENIIKNIMLLHVNLSVFFSEIQRRKNVRRPQIE